MNARHGKSVNVLDIKNDKFLTRNYVQKESNMPRLPSKRLHGNRLCKLVKYNSRARKYSEL